MQILKLKKINNLSDKIKNYLYFIDSKKLFKPKYKLLEKWNWIGIRLNNSEELMIYIFNS